MAPGSGVLTDLLNLFMYAIVPGYGRLLPDAKTLLTILATLEIALAGMWMAFDGGHKIEVTFLKKVMQIGFFVWVINNYQWLSSIIMKGFVHAGVMAGGGTTPTSLIEDPSRIIEYGFAVTAPVFDHTQNYSLMTVSIRHALDMLTTQLSAVLIVIAFFGIALLVFITYLEFYLISALGLILVPFGVFKHTSFLAEKVFGAIIAFGIRLMVLAFILSVTQQTLSSFVLPPDPTVKQISLVLFTAVTVMGLSWHAPAIASGLMAGSPGLGLGAVAGTGLAVAGVVAAAGSMVTEAARQIAQAGHLATAAAAKRGGGEGRGGSGEGGAGTQTAASMTPSAGPVTTSSGSPVSTSDKSSAISAAPAWAQNLSPKKASDNSVIPSSSSSGPGWANRLLMTRGAIPHDTHSGGGVSVPLRGV